MLVHTHQARPSGAPPNRLPTVEEMNFLRGVAARVCAVPDDSPKVMHLKSPPESARGRGRERERERERVRANPNPSPKPDPNPKQVMHLKSPPESPANGSKGRNYLGFGSGFQEVSPNSLYHNLPSSTA
jgi:hypothetical protein